MQEHWTVDQYKEYQKKGNKKSKGLNRFNRNGSIIIYREEVLE